MERYHIKRFNSLNNELIKNTNYDDVDSLLYLISKLESYIEDEKNHVDEKDLIRKVLSNLKRKLIILFNNRISHAILPAYIENTVLRLKEGEVPNLFIPGFKLSKMESAAYDKAIFNYSRKKKVKK